MSEEPKRYAFPVEPLDGMFGLKPPSKIPIGGSPDMLNCYVRGDTLRKRPGYSQLGNAVHASERVMGLFSAWDEDDVVYLFAVHQTGLKKYDVGSSTWTAYTGPALTGGTEKKFDWAISQNSVVFGNGVDQVMRIPFTGTAYAILNANCPPARYVTRFADRLYIAFTVEGAASKPFRVRRSVNGDHTNWTGLGSGFTDLSEYPYHIKGLRKHGAVMVVTAEQAIWIATRTGTAAAPARFDPSVPGTGVYMPYTLTTRGNDQLFYGRDHVYLFSVGNRVIEIMDAVRDSIFFNLEAAKVHLNHSITRPETQEWITFIVEPGSSTPGAAWIWNWHYNICYKWSFAEGVMCAEIHRQQVSRTWNGLIGDWNSQTWEWSGAEATQNFPVLITGNANGVVYEWKEDFASDAGQPILCRWSSKDFSASLILQQESRQQLALRALVIEYQATGTPCTLQFSLSTDGGNTWSGPYPVSLDMSENGGSGYYTAVLTEQISGDKIRWKFEHQSATERFRISRFIPEFEILGMVQAHQS